MKRKRGEENEDARAPKQVKTTVIKTEDEDMREAATAWTKDRQKTRVWENDTDESDFKEARNRPVLRLTE